MNADNDPRAATGASEMLRGLTSPRAFLAALISGLGALATMAAGFNLPIPGTGIMVDSREVFVLLGGSMAGPFWGALTGVLAGLVNPVPGLTLYSVLQHVVSAVFIGAAYAYAYQRFRMPYLLVAWVVLVFLSYYVTSLPGLWLLGTVDPDLVAATIGRRLAPLDLVLLEFRTTFIEYAFTLTVTTAAIAVLPRRYRRPLWLPASRIEEAESRHERAAARDNLRDPSEWNYPLLAAVAFGLGGFLVIWARLHFTIPGTNALSDPREFFVYLGSAFAGPLYAPIVGILASLPEPNPDLRIYVILQHVVSALWVAWLYRWLMAKARPTAVILAGWLFIIFGTYYIIYLPGFFLLSAVSPETFRILVGTDASALAILPVVLNGWFPEFVITVLATGITLYVLPERHRIPLDVRRRSRDRSSYPSRAPSPVSNFLGVRLTLWFLLLSFAPLIVVGVFIRNDVATELGAIQARQQQDLAELFAQELRVHQIGELEEVFRRVESERHHQLCLIDRSGTYVFHPDSMRIGTHVSWDVGAENVQRILALSQGPIVETLTGRTVGVAPIAGRQEIVLAFADAKLIGESLRDLERLSYVKLSTSLLLLSFVGGMVIWVIVARPMRKLTWAAREIGQGNLAASVDARDMDDEVAILAHAFNDMTRSLRSVHRGLELEIAQRAAAEEALRESERQFRLLAENSTDMISRHDPNGVYLYASPSCRALLGYSPEELVGRNAYDFILPADWSVVAHAQALLMAHVAIAPVTYRMLRKDGGTVWVESTSRGIADEDRRVLELHIATRDVSSRKQAEQALMESEERLRTVVTNSPVVLFAIDAAGIFTLSEGKGLEALGLRPGQVVGQSVYDVYCDFPTVIDSIRRGLAGELHSDTFVIGETIFDTWIAPVRSPSGDVSGIIGIATNVTERRRMEAAVRESEAMYKTLVQQSNDAVYVLQDHRMVFVNHAWEEMFGYSHAEATDPSFDFESIVAPESLTLIRDRFAVFDAGQMPARRYEMRGITRAGETLDLDVSVAQIEWRGRRAVQGIYRDITERKRAEAVILQKQKMESLGVLAGGVAHDFNNLLQAILGHISLSVKRTSPGSPALANLQKAESAAERAADLTRQLLAYSGRGKFDIRALSLNEIIKENLHLLEVAVHKSIRLDQELAAKLPLIQADAGQIQQVVMNLIINASEAIGDRPGRILLRTSRKQIDKAHVESWSQPGHLIEPGNYVLLEVADDGSGMSPETVRRIFDPFFTTKFTGRGLGLSAVLGIVRGHRGGIQVRSEETKGTSFLLVFPEFNGEAPKGKAAAEGSRIVGFTGSVLVIDDEEDVRQVVQDILQDAGIKVLTASNGEAGFALYRQRKPEIALVLLDLSMPGWGGRETFLRMKEFDPRIRVVMSSGFSETEMTEEFRGLGVAGFLQKPYRWDKLVGILQDLLRA